MSSPDDVRNEPFECLAAITAAMVTVAGPRRTRTGFLEIGRCIDPPTSWHHTTTRPGSAPACQGEQTVKTEMLPSMAYLEVPQTNFGTFVLKANIVKDKGAITSRLQRPTACGR